MNPSQVRNFIAILILLNLFVGVFLLIENWDHIVSSEMQKEIFPETLEQSPVPPKPEITTGGPGPYTAKVDSILTPGIPFAFGKLYRVIIENDTLYLHTHQALILK